MVTANRKLFWLYGAFTPKTKVKQTRVDKLKLSLCDVATTLSLQTCVYFSPTFNVWANSRVSSTIVKREMFACNQSSVDTSSAHNGVGRRRKAMQIAKTCSLFLSLIFISNYWKLHNNFRSLKVCQLPCKIHWKFVLHTQGVVAHSVSCVILWFNSHTSKMYHDSGV